MREFTKSAISYGWASTCFQMQQLVNMFSIDPETRNSAATGAFNAVAEATAARLGPTLRSTYRAGDAVQRGMVNMMFGMAGNWGGACDGSGGPRRVGAHGDQSGERGFDVLGSASASGFPAGRPAVRQEHQ